MCPQFFSASIHRLMDLEEDDISARRESSTHQSIVEVQHVTDHLLFATFEDALLGGLFEEQANLLGSDGGLLRPPHAKQSQNAVRGGAEQDDNRAADAGEELHRGGNQACDSFRGRKSQPLRDELPENQGHVREHQNDEAERERAGI